MAMLRQRTRPQRTARAQRTASIADRTVRVIRNVDLKYSVLFGRLTRRDESNSLFRRQHVDLPGIWLRDVFRPV